MGTQTYQADNMIKPFIDTTVKIQMNITQAWCSILYTPDYGGYSIIVLVWIFTLIYYLIIQSDMLNITTISKLFYQELRIDWKSITTIVQGSFVQGPNSQKQLLSKR